jgi:lipopolysaccharide/colanic/teichoic acid biosynthesis glycosyltransferase
MVPELEALSPAALDLLQPIGSPRRGLVVRTAAWTLRGEEWERCEPSGVYAKSIRGPFLLALSVLLVPPALLLLFPLVLTNAWLHGGLAQAFFAQVRVGRRGRPFVLYKLRTMRSGPGCLRVTPFGRFLRNSHLDELPQLWNVLCGDMCLIGPRPEMVATERWAAACCPGFAERLVLAPGLTGLAQITQGYTEGGDMAAYRTKSALNRRYREELSLALDCAILARTLLWMLRRRGWRRHPAAKAAE